ncbi:hypothetical protein MPSEU_000443100 [Mayamaea pseudoterrestris]|nr:hypothetical protein MPSEU_000443100 [Mayamaea pseudoterrestris]
MHNLAPSPYTTSSSDLKKKQIPRKRNNETSATATATISNKESVVKRLKQAATRAYIASKTNEGLDSTKPKLKTVRQLMAELDRELARISKFEVFRRPGDSLRSVQKHNLKTPRPNTSHKRDVAVLLAKALSDDCISIEGAARIQCLVKRMVEEDYEPDLIVFVGPRSGDDGGKNLVADADGSYLYFRHLCKSVGLQLRRTEIRLEHHSIDQKALQEVVQYIQTHCKPQWIEAMVNEETRVDIDQESAKNFRKKLSIHFSFFSSEYQLCQLNDIHVRSPNQSALRALTQLAGSSTTTSWSFFYTVTSTNFNDPVRALAGKTYKSAQDLVPVLSNLRGVINDREFFQADNYKVLVAVRNSILADMEGLYQTEPTLQSIRKAMRPQDATLDVVLEGALMSLGRCLDVVRPAGLMTGRCSREDFERALNLLQQAYYLLDRSCDPVLPLPPQDWGVLGTDAVDEMATAVDDDRRGEESSNLISIDDVIDYD